MDRFLIATAMSVCATIGNGAFAQEADDGVIDEIIVTALKRTNQTQATAPASIDIIDGVSIDDLGADSLLDVLPSVPALSIDSDGVGYTTIQIRGVNTTFGAASVGYYVDGAPFSLVNLNQLPDLDPFDLQSIEILKGPQGTLYGAGSAGGVVLMRTNPPNLTESEAGFRHQGWWPEDQRVRRRKRPAHS